MSIKTILYVEDEEGDVLLMRMAFKHHGLAEHLRIVTDGQQAIDYLNGAGPFANRTEHPVPALVLLDLHLPFVSGFEVVEWLRQQPHLPPVPVLIFSSSDREEDRIKSLALGANAYLRKPASGFRDVVWQIHQEWLMPT